MGLIAAHRQAVFPVETLYQAGDKAATEELQRLKQGVIDKSLYPNLDVKADDGPVVSVRKDNMYRDVFLFRDTVTDNAAANNEITRAP